MKHQYYADSRDVWKWTFLVRLARQCGLNTILQIAMLTLDDGTSHGGQRDDPPGADTTVARFFLEERQTIDSDPSLKRIERITHLGSFFTPPLTIKVIVAPFDNRNRDTYFREVCNRIQALLTPMSVWPRKP